MTPQLPHVAEVTFMKIGAVLGVIWAVALESVAPLVYWFALFVVVDFITGTIAACKAGEWASHRLWSGMMKKGLSFGFIILAHGIDVAFALILRDIPLFQSITLCAYCLGEFGSVIENVERMGYGSALPPILRRLFLTLEKRLENAVDSKLDQIGLDDEEKDKKTK